MFLFRFFLCMLMLSQPACSQKVHKPVLFMNASVHRGNGEVIENAALAFQDEKITLLADARIIRLDMTAFEVVEAYGLQVYPASLVEALPASAKEIDSLYYVDWKGSQSKLLAADAISDHLPLQLLEVGAEATFVITDQPLKAREVLTRYLVVKGAWKQENNVSLRLLDADQ